MTTQILAEAGQQWAAIRGVGVTIPAPLSDGILLDRAILEHEAWSGWNAAEEVANYFSDRQVIVENDANATAYGEWRQLDPTLQSGLIVVVNVGPGFGGAMLLNGQLIRGQGSAGELGRLNIAMDPYDYFHCAGWKSPKVGMIESASVESFASLRGMARQIEEIFSDRNFDTMQRHPLREFGRTNTGDLDWSAMASGAYQLAEFGEELCVNLFKLREEAIGRLFASICLITDPHLIVIGGSVLKKSSEQFRKQFTQGVIEHMKQQLRVVKPYSVIASDIGSEASTFGAAMLARDSVLESRVP